MFLVDVVYSTYNDPRLFLFSNTSNFNLVHPMGAEAHFSPYLPLAYIVKASDQTPQLPDIAVQ
jgi:hypothetical protein